MANDYIVSKFGGWANSSAELVKTAADLFENDSRRRVKVDSAIGKVENLPKVTDLLVQAAEYCLTHDDDPLDIVETLTVLHQKVFEPLGLSKNQIDETLAPLVGYFSKRTSLSPDYFRALIMGSGEEFFSKLDAIYLREIRKLDAHYVDPAGIGHMLTGHPMDGKITPETYGNLQKLKDMKGIIVYPGFFGIDHAGRRMVYSRGGTDKTAADIAAATDASLYENWKEVDGVYSADPRIIKDACQMKEVTYKEIRELTYINFQVLHQEAMLPVMRKGIPISLRNLINQSNPGTTIVQNRTVEKNRPIIGIAHKEKMAFINLEKILINEEIGFTNRLLSIFERHHINIEQITTGIDSICLVITEDELKSKTVYAGVSELIRHEIEPNEFAAHLLKELEADQVNIRMKKALVCIVGEGMKHMVGIMSRISRVISDNGINIEIIDQGSSERNVIIGVNCYEDKDAAKKVVKLLYDEFFNSDN